MQSCGRCTLVCAVVLCFLQLSALAGIGTEPVRYDGHVLIRAYPTSWEQNTLIREHGGRLVGCFEGFAQAEYVIHKDVLAALDTLGISYVVIDDDIQEAIDAERTRLTARDDADPRDPAWFDDYRGLPEIEARLNALAADRPDLCTLLDLGDSIEGRSILAVRIAGPGDDKPAVLLHGLQHAREWIAAMVPMYVADRLVYGYDDDPQIRSLVDRVEFFIVPVSNPDGYEYSWSTDRLWRKNRRDNPDTDCDGVDLNRNWGVGWGGGGSSGSPCDETYRGTAAFSEPETVALRDFCAANPQIVSSIDFHSFAQLILSPYGYTYTLPEDHGLFMELGAAMRDEVAAVHGKEYGYGPICSMAYRASGACTDWCYDQEDVFAFTFELRDTGYHGFELPPDEILPTAEENLAAVLYLADWSSTPVRYRFPNGLPARVTPASPEMVAVNLRVLGSAALDVASLRLYSRVAGDGDFVELELVPLGDDSYEATLPATPCGHMREYYFSAATTAGITVLSPSDAPMAVYEARAVPTSIVFSANMDQDPAWNCQGDWSWGQPIGAGGEYGNPDPTSGSTGDAVCGFNLAGDYANDMPEQHLTTPAIDCSAATGVRLSFDRWLGVEQPAFDHAHVRLSVDGDNWSTIWQNSEQITDDSWVHQELDLSSLADGQPTVYLRWTMGTTDGGWRFCGWNIDDVLVTADDPAGCPPLPGDLNCDGAVNAFDIDPFVLAVVSIVSSESFEDYLEVWPDCDGLLADCNQDGSVNALDIDAFAALLSR